MRKILGTTAVIVIGATIVAGVAPVNAAPSMNQVRGPLQLAQGYGDQPRFEERGNYALYNGYRGYHTRHPGYREYQGYWFPPAAFVGAAIGGAIMNGLMNGGAPPRQQEYPLYDEPSDEQPYDPSY